MSDDSVVWNILQIVIPSLLFVGGGSIAYWKWLQEQNRNTKEAKVKQKQELSDYKLRADQAAWERVQYTIDYQDSRIKDLQERCVELESEVKTLREMLKEK